MILSSPKHNYRLTLISAVIVAALSKPAYAETFNPEDCKKPAGVTLNFSNADIKEVITSVSSCIGKNILIDPRVTGKVTILSKTPLRKESVYDVLLDVLRTHGAVAIEQGDVIKIVPIAEAKQNTASTTKAIPGGGEQITRVVKIKNISAPQLVALLKPLTPTDAYLQAYLDTNVLVISDSKKNVQRLMNIIETLDKPSQHQDQIVPLSQANADEVAKILQGSQPKKTENSATVTADRRSNSIILSGNKAERERYQKLIRQLDTPIANHSAHHVVPLKYAKAMDLAPVLDKVINKSGSNTVTGVATAPGTAPTAAPNSTATNIIADEATNSLIISADLQNYQSLLEVLKQLDIPRLQVMIEAIIAEVSFDNSRKLGVEWGVKSSNNVGIGNKPQSSGLLGLIGDLANSDLTKALLTGGFSALISRGDIGVMLNAIQNDSNANILSAPHILTLNNKEATMVVGENVPFITGAYTTQASSGTNANINPFTTVQRQDVGLILKVKPQINPGGMISLEIEQETSAVKDVSGSAGITTTKRSMKSNVTIANGNMLVLGGLMDDQTNDGADSLPLLGDIPLLGYLFKTEKTSIRKRTLMVFIKPTIVDSEVNGKIKTDQTISAVEKQQQKFNQKDMLLTPDPNDYQIKSKFESPHEPPPELNTQPKTATE